MGVENVGPLLYSIVRFTKVRKIVEIGAGFTTLWLLQALKDNYDEMTCIQGLHKDGKCRLLDIQWSVPDNIDRFFVDDINKEFQSSVLSIDNCLHQRESASGVSAAASTLGLDKYLKFIKEDAYKIQFEPESVDLLWCDFGVGSRMKDFVSSAWKSIRLGGYLVCHSTLTNSRTREWLEAIRKSEGQNVTGIPNGEFSEISLLEPTKHYQNSISVLQRRSSPSGIYNEPIYSEYA